MNVSLRRAFGAAAAVGIALAVAALSHVPYAAHRGEGAQLRLAWRYRSERIEACRRLTAEELERLPGHMRRAEVCEGGIRPYFLEVVIDGRRAALDTARASGAHADRPLYVFREFSLAPGRHRIAVAFTPDTSVRGRSVRVAAPAARFEIEEEMVLGPREVALLSYDEELGRLVLRRRP